jgi:hypothetical protein
VTLRLNGSTSGYTEIDAPAVAGSNTLVLPTGAGSAYQVVRNGATAGSLEFTDKIVSGTAVASTSGTSIDFTGIPSWVKRVTVMFNGVSTTPTALNRILIQIGAGSVDTSSYNSTCMYGDATAMAHASSTNGFLLHAYTAADVKSGIIQLATLGTNIWVASGWLKISTTQSTSCMGDKTLSGTLDRVRITTVNGTDTFDAGSINILYE